MSDLTFQPSLEQILEAVVRRAVREELQALKADQDGGDRLLDAKEAAPLLGVSPAWLYKNHRKLPFTVKVHHKMLRFSYQGIQRYIGGKKNRARS